jgi:hypothetical protein
MKKLLIPLLFAGLAVGCNGDALAPPTDDVSLVASVVAGCQAVRFDVALVLGPGGGVGTVTGDLVGTIETEFPNAGVWHGKAFLNDGIDFIKVGSSSVPGLAGQTIELRHDNMAVGAPGLGALARINGHGTIVSPENVSGNLTFHGTFDISPPPPFAVDLTYRGNICVGY